MKTESYIAALGLFLFASCNEIDYTAREAAPGPDFIDISEVVVALPDSAGKELVEINCLTCHSLRYIEMQPRFSRKTWEKTVTKMIKNYGAPVQDSVTAARIVDYLVRIKGAG